MEFGDYLSVFRKGWWLLLGSLLLGLGIAAGLTALSPRMYTGKASVFFSVEGANSAGDLASGSTYAERQVKSYAQVASSPLVLDPVIRKLNLQTAPGRLQSRVTATVPTGTVIIEIAARDADPTRAANIANEVARQLSTAVHDLSPKDSRGQATAAATVIRPASANFVPTSPNWPQNLILGGLAGLALGIGLMVLRGRLDTAIHDLRDVKQVTDHPIVGMIPLDKDGGTATIGREPSDSLQAEAYRRLRTNLAFLEVDQHARWFVVTSSVPMEGKSTTSLNLAITMAQAGQRVLLVEADLRRPTLSKYLGLENGVGLTTVLIGRATLDEVVQPVGDDGLDVLTSGPLPPNPSELLGSKTMMDVLEAAAREYDAVLLDCPPLLPVTDAAILAGHVGSALLVVGNDVVRKPEVEQALTALHNVDVEHIAIIYNRVPARGSSYSYRYHYTTDNVMTAPAGRTPLDAANRAATDETREVVLTHPHPATSARRDMPTGSRGDAEDHPGEEPRGELPAVTANVAPQEAAAPAAEGGPALPRQRDEQ